jgi:two-component system chemotaxis response regulator CheB
VQLAQDGMALEHGQICFVPGGMQAQVDRKGLCLRENDERDRFCPSIDTLFRTAARTYGVRVIGVVLSGLLYDGAAGLAAIVRAGGVGVIQSPWEAKHAPMPQWALKAAPKSYCLPAGVMAPLLINLVSPPMPLVVPASPHSAVAEVLAAENHA